MEDAEEVMRSPAKEPGPKQERTLNEASGLFRERGFENASFGEVMKTAGLTREAFHYCNLEYSDLAATRMGTLRSASFHSAKKS
jgi:hypothetical protein